MTEWRWYRDTYTKCLFLHLLLTANYKDAPYKRITVRRGQVLTSISRLSRELDIPEITVRRKLDNLKSTGEVVTETTNKWTIITICNYESYQGSQKTNERTNEQASEQTSEQTNIQNNRYTDIYPPSPPKGGVSPLKKTFVAPTLEVVKTYFETKRFKSDPVEFWVYFQNTDWKLSGGRGAKMKDWRLAAINWEKREKHIRK